MRIGRHRAEAVSPLSLPELKEATADLVEQLRDMVERLDRSARIGTLAIRKQRGELKAKPPPKECEEQ